MSQAPDQESHDTRRGVAVHRINPFLAADVPTKTRRVTSKRGNMMLVNGDTGEIQSNIAGFWEAEEVDSSKFVKLFVNGVRALAELTSAGARVFELLYIEMQNNIGQDQIYLSYTQFDGTERSMSRATFKRGLAELIEKRFLAAMSTTSWYWVNPDFVWNGDRLAFVKEYRRKASPKPLARDPRQMDIEDMI